MKITGNGAGPSRLLWNMQIRVTTSWEGERSDTLSRSPSVASDHSTQVQFQRVYVHAKRLSSLASRRVRVRCGGTHVTFLMMQP